MRDKIASAAWADAVNAAYEAGIVLVCAAGNNFDGWPTDVIIWPARFNRVIAACGIMADGRPYFNLPRWVMQGNYGPPSKMTTALAGFTSNITGRSSIVKTSSQEHANGKVCSHSPGEHFRTDWQWRKRGQILTSTLPLKADHQPV